MVAMHRVRTVFVGLPGSPYLSTMYFLGGAGTAQDAVDAVGTFWSAVDANIFTDLNWSTDGDVDTVESSTGLITGVIATTPASGSGGLATDYLPPATQGLVQWRTGAYVGGRELRGKTFIPGLTEGGSTDGQPNSTVLSATNAAAAALIADTDSQLLVFSRKNLTNAAVSAGTMWAQFAVLRSRRD